MYIDDCRYTFPELANTILPAYLAQLEDTRKRPWSARAFAQAGDGPATIASNLGLASDFSGCYVLLEGERPIYVGISRKVLSRLRQHLRGKSLFDASFAYSIAQ